jgi:hypothetical protein
MKVDYLNLSDNGSFPVGSNVTDFFSRFYIDYDIQIIEFLYDPEGVDYDYLANLDYHAKIIFWVCTDSIIDKSTFNYYADKAIKPFDKMQDICRHHSDKKFVLLCHQSNLEQYVNVPNLYVEHMINIKLEKRYKKCRLKNFGNKPRSWFCINNSLKEHRLAVISHLLGENKVSRYGKIGYTPGFKMERERFLDIIKDYFKFNKGEMQQIINGYNNLCKSSFSRLTNSVIKDPIDNYNYNLYPVYESTLLEIITGSLYFEPTPFFSEKEIQCVYGMNFFIFINCPYSINVFKNKFGFDVFDDIIDHSYDSIRDPTQRLVQAIDCNKNLLTSPKTLANLWKENRQRFEKNIDLMDNYLYNKEFQQDFDFGIIKKVLKDMDIDVRLKEYYKG